MAPRAKRGPDPIPRLRCAVYTRKSHEEGLEGDFNSLDQQRESCESYIASQRAEGWVALEERYDDPAFSAATTERPALKRLLRDVESGRVDAVIVYKIDRLSRSLRDFGRLMDLFDAHQVSFVSVTQRFDTSSSMGKLTLNVLMSFAEFEREVIGERIRDKVAAAKRRGKHTGGVPVLGYDTDRAAKRLVVNAREAELVRRIFRRFAEIRSTTKLAAELNSDGLRTKGWVTKTGKRVGGKPWGKAAIYKLIHNPLYRGLVQHRGETYPGEHEAIVSEAEWGAVHRVLKDNHRARGNETRSKTPALLRGLVRCVHCDRSMGATYTRRHGRTYRYYLCGQAGKAGYETCPVRSVAAGEIEDAVVDQLRRVFRTPEIIARTYAELRVREVEEAERLRGERERLGAELELLVSKRDRLLEVSGESRSLAEELRRTGGEIDTAEDRAQAIDLDLRELELRTITEADVTETLERLDPLWEELFPAERARIVVLLLERVDVRVDGLELRIRADGLRSLTKELIETRERHRHAG